MNKMVVEFITSRNEANNPAIYSGGSYILKSLPPNFPPSINFNLKRPHQSDETKSLGGGATA